MKQTYIRCPRCELNYILSKDKYCNVCKAEMKAQGTLGADDENDLELCPVCKVNYISSNEDMCQQCAMEHGQEDDDVDTVKNNDNWGDNYLSSDEDDASYDEESSDMVSISNLDDTPIDDEMDLDLSGDDEEDDTQDMDDDNLDENEDSDFDDDIDSDDDLDYDDDDDEDDEDDYDDDEDADDYKKSSKK